jgi:hypothetical protein
MLIGMYRYSVALKEPFRQAGNYYFTRLDLHAIKYKIEKKSCSIQLYNG